MKILVNHLTRMQPGYICVAGIKLGTLDHVRPVLAGRLKTDLLRREGGLFDLGCVVDLGATVLAGQPPEVEDHRFDPNRASLLYACDPDEYWFRLQSVSRPTLQGIFGTDLKRRGRSCTVDLDSGRVSLGVLSPQTPPTLHLNRYVSIRVRLTAGRHEFDLSVTDLRLCEADHRTPRRHLVQRIAQRIMGGEGVVLSVGLTRPFQSGGDTTERHWLQVNNIHLESDPLWDETLGTKI